MLGYESMGSDVVISVENLVKYYGSLKALDRISFQVRRGEIYGLLGPNGAGKTTTLKIIVGLLKPSSGTVKVLNYSPVEDAVNVKRVIGYVPEEVYLYESLTVREFFEFVASVRGLSEEVFSWVDMLVKSFNIEEYYDYPIASLSQGTKQKVTIISALMHKPEVLILDEPIKGLDAKSARIFKEIMHLHIQNGGAILFSTHIMDIAENICTRIGIIHKGRILAEGSVDDLKRMVNEPTGTLEEVFLELTREREEVTDIINELRRVF